jgi:hypothetical protein
VSGGGANASREQPHEKSHEQIAIIGRKIPAISNWRGPTYISAKEITMFKVAVVAFALAVSGFMLWIAHEDANFAQMPHAVFMKRAA